MNEIVQRIRVGGTDKKSSIPTPEALRKQLDEALSDNRLDPNELNFDKIKKEATVAHCEILIDFLQKARDIPSSNPRVSPATQRLILNQLEANLTSRIETFRLYQKQILEVFPDPIEVPENIDQLTGVELYLAKREERIAQLIGKIQKGIVPDSDLDIALVSFNLRRTGDPKLVELAAQSYLTMQPSLSRPTSQFTMAMDLDIPKHRNVLRKWIDENSDSLGSDYTFQRLQNHLRLKAGESVDLSKLPAGYSKLGYLVSIENLPRLKQEIAKTTFKGTNLLELQIAYLAFEMLGMDKELELIRDIFEESIPDYVTRVWTRDEEGPNLTALVFAMRALGKTTKDIPEGLKKRLPDPRATDYLWSDSSRTYGEVRWLEFHENWDLVIQIGEDGHRARPTTIDWMETLARAYDATGNGERAAHFSSLYLEYARGIHTYPEILRIHRKHE